MVTATTVAELHPGIWAVRRIRLACRAVSHPRPDCCCRRAVPLLPLRQPAEVATLRYVESLDRAATHPNAEQRSRKA